MDKGIDRKRQIHTELTESHDREKVFWGRKEWKEINVY
jgi:hypothetical protein